MTQNYKEINLESIEMIDKYYFFIHKEPKFFCLETFYADKFKEQKNILNKIMGDQQSIENSIGITSYMSIQNNKKLLKVVYSSYSLKVLKEYTANINLALEDEIIEFIKNLNEDSE